MDLTDKRLIVTGAAGGIGLATAGVLIAAGARVVIADMDRERAKDAAASFPEGRATAIAVDVAKAESVRAMIDETLARFGGLDGMFNNAGIMDPGDKDVTETDETVWDRVIAVNLKGIFQCCRFGIPAMLASGGGSIVNNASVVGLMGSYPSQIAYTASKGGILAVTRELGVAYGHRGIRVNAVLPGVTQTAMSRQVDSSADSPDHGARLQHIPMGRYGKPAEIGETVAFLLSDRAGYVTAQTWAVDGGLTGAYLCPPSPDATPAPGRD